MLVISRRIGESFLIGDNIEAVVVDITGDKVVLGFNAPRDVPISRSEVDESARYNRQAADASSINMNGFAKLYKKKFPGKNQGHPQ